MKKCLKSEVFGTHEQCTVHCWKVKTRGWKKKKTQTWIRKHGSKRIPSVYTLIISKIVDESNLFYESPRKMLEKISQASLE